MKWLIEAIAENQPRGVAHDFNNILTAIIGFSNIVLMKMQGNDPLRHYIEQVLESSNRATGFPGRSSEENQGVH